MEIAGTIHNEVRVGVRSTFPPTSAPAHRLPSMRAAAEAGRYRNISECRRGRRGSTSRAGSNETAAAIRRTRIRRTRQEIAAEGMQLAAEARDIIFDPAVYPSPAAHCAVCDFAAPCLALFAASDPEPILKAQFRQRPATLSPSRGWARPPGASAEEPHRRSGANNCALTYISFSFNLGWCTRSTFSGIRCGAASSNCSVRASCRREPSAPAFRASLRSLSLRCHSISRYCGTTALPRYARRGSDGSTPSTAARCVTSTSGSMRFAASGRHALMRWVPKLRVANDNAEWERACLRLTLTTKSTRLPATSGPARSISETRTYSPSVSPTTPTLQTSGMRSPISSAFRGGSCRFPAI